MASEDICDAWTFFKMVDDDGGGTIPMDEFLMGCLRLRGQARAVDVACQGLGDVVS